MIVYKSLICCFKSPCSNISEVPGTFEGRACTAEYKNTCCVLSFTICHQHVSQSESIMVLQVTKRKIRKFSTGKQLFSLCISLCVTQRWQTYRCCSFVHSDLQPAGKPYIFSSVFSMHLCFSHFFLFTFLRPGHSLTFPSIVVVLMAGPQGSAGVSVVVQQAILRVCYGTRKRVSAVGSHFPLCSSSFDLLGKAKLTHMGAVKHKGSKGPGKHY